MNWQQAEQYLRQELQVIYSESEATNIASMAMEKITGSSKTEKVFQKENILSNEQQELLDNFLQKLKKHEPIQYVLNEAWFHKLKLYVDNHVLIPRPETEELVEWVLEDVKKRMPEVFHRNRTEADKTKSLKILDVGTGSGCIALALKNEMPAAEVWGCDISEAALNIARRNGSLLDIRVDFQGVDFLEVAQQKFLPTVDILVSNPPYIPQQDKEQMHKNVVDHEPHTALFVPDNDPLIFYKALAAFAKHRLYDDGCIYCEIHEDLGEDVLNLFITEGFHNVDLRKDMQNKDRMVKVSKS